MEYLSKYTVMESTDVGEVEAMVASFSTPFKMKVTGPETGFNARVNFAKLHDLDLVHSTFGDPRIDWYSEGDNEESYFFFIPTKGGGEISHRNRQWEFSENKGVIRDMGLEASAFQKNFHSFVMTLPKERLASHARALGGEHCALGGVIFDPEADLSTPGGQLLANTIKSVAQALDGPLAEINHNELIMAQYSDLILTQILTQLSNTSQEELNGQAASYIVPRHIKRARDYIHAHIAEKLDMAVLADVSGCSYRTLQRGFMSAFGVSPLQYIRKVRLKAVYDEINFSSEVSTVSSIARKWGFSHMGRFAQEYQKEFGIYPKDHREK